MTTTAPSTDNLALLARVIRDVTRARRIPPPDAEDFAQTVQLRLLERDYDVFKRYAGRSSLRTYLTVVVQRLLLDWQNHEYGKWRPSLAATRLGPFAVELERRIQRDSHTREEAIQLVREHPDAPPVAELRRLIDALPNRLRRHRVSDEILTGSQGVDFQDPVVALEKRTMAARAQQVLASELQRLPADDRELIVLRYQHRESVQDLAQRRRVEPKALYRRFDRVLRMLRDRLTEQGITPMPT